MFRYLYQPLLYKDSIRILILHPSSNDLDPIICTIQHARLSDASLKYEALSYTWGLPGSKKIIQFSDSDQVLMVGENCYNALRRLRRKDVDRSLWIDAISINQDDLAERARQVRIMDRIYNLASRVVVYLGEQLTDCGALLDELAAVDDLMRHGEYEEHTRTPPNNSIVQQLAVMFELPWFKRVWVLQEVFAKTSIIFMYGSAIASSKALVALYFGYRYVAVTPRPLALKWILGLPTKEINTHIDLWRVLFESRGLLATDPRDRVFALKAIVGSAKGELDALIDYTKSVEECFTEVALFLLPVLGLRLLLAVRHPHSLETDSWIPDWSQNLPLDQFEEVRKIEPADERHYKINRIINVHQRVCLELCVRGCRYAKVAFRSCVFSFRDLNDCEMQLRHFHHGLQGLETYVDMKDSPNAEETAEKLGEEILDSK